MNQELIDKAENYLRREYGIEKEFEWLPIGNQGYTTFFISEDKIHFYIVMLNIELRSLILCKKFHQKQL